MVMSLTACTKAAPGAELTLAPFPSPTPRPHAEVTLADALDGALYTISAGERLLAVEEIAVQDTESGMVLYSELRSNEGLEVLQRRTLLLSSGGAPLRYELEESSGGARSLWIAERSGGVITVLSDDLNLPLPVQQEGLAPPPSALIEGRPSALPYALLAWQQTDASPSEERDRAVLDVTDLLPQARSLKIDAGGAMSGLVVGSEGYHATVADALNPEFDVWARTKARSLVRVEVPNYHWGVSSALAMPGLRDGETLTIERVTTLPDLSGQPPAHGIAWAFPDGQGAERQAWLRLPEGDFPHPVAILLGPEGLRPAWQGGDALVSAGWATLSYLPRGLATGKVRYERGAYAAWAADAVAAAQALTARADIDTNMIVLLGWRGGAVVAAEALAAEAPVRAAVLIEPPAPGPLFPNTLTWRNEHVLASACGWQSEQTARYGQLTVGRARDWLFDNTHEVTVLGRRLDLTYLRIYADTNLASLLKQSRQPVLLLGDPAGRQTPADAATRLAADLSAAGRPDVEAGNVADAAVDEDEELTAPAAAAIVAWLSALP